MDDNFGRNRIIGFACALVAGVLVIMAGKSCADDAIEQNKKLHKSEIVDPDIILPGEGPAGTEPAVPESTAQPVMTTYDVFGNVIVVTEPPVTDIFGNIIEPAAPADPEGAQFETVTDVFGNVIGTVPVTAQTTAVTTIDPALITTLNPIDQYNEDLKKPNPNSGYYHGQYTYNEENDKYEPVPTIPPDFVIEIH